ncbi:MAG: hypothetical protein ACKV2T_07990 [Kofleriaceae bacterium]
MRSRSLVTLSFGCALLSACSFAFVRELNDSANNPPPQPLICTTSRVLPTIDLIVGAILGGLVWGVTYAAVDDFNDECTGGGCGYRPWKPALLGSFLVVSPWWISSLVGYSDTKQCRAAFRARGTPLH